MSLSREPVMVQCTDCGGMTESAHDYTRISFLRSRQYRCPDCYHRWRAGDQRSRGQRYTCSIPRCRSPWLSPEEVREVIDPTTEAVYILCPDCADRLKPAVERTDELIKRVSETNYKQGMYDAEARRPVTMTVPVNPHAVDHIAATLSLVAPDLTSEECKSVAESLHDMVTPRVITRPVIDPGDADPKALEDWVAVDYLALLSKDVKPTPVRELLSLFAQTYDPVTDRYRLRNGTEVTGEVLRMQLSQNRSGKGIKAGDLLFMSDRGQGKSMLGVLDGVTPVLDVAGPDTARIRLEEAGD